MLNDIPKKIRFDDVLLVTVKCPIWELGIFPIEFLLLNTSAFRFIAKLILKLKGKLYVWVCLIAWYEISSNTFVVQWLSLVTYFNQYLTHRFLTFCWTIHVREGTKTMRKSCLKRSYMYMC